MTPVLNEYLIEYGRGMDQQLHYSELTEYREQIPLYAGAETYTLWQTAPYTPSIRDEFNVKLSNIYALLKTEGNTSFLRHLFIDRVDFCEYGNSQPFRKRVVNRYDDNHDCYYEKRRTPAGYTGSSVRCDTG